MICVPVVMHSLRSLFFFIETLYNLAQFRFFPTQFASKIPHNFIFFSLHPVRRADYSITFSPVYHWGMRFHTAAEEILPHSFLPNKLQSSKTKQTKTEKTIKMIRYLIFQWTCSWWLKRGITLPTTDQLSCGLTTVQINGIAYLYCTVYGASI